MAKRRRRSPQVGHLRAVPQTQSGIKYSHVAVHRLTTVAYTRVSKLGRRSFGGVVLYPPCCPHRGSHHRQCSFSSIHTPGHDPAQYHLRRPSALSHLAPSKMPQYFPLATPRLTPEILLSRLIRMTAKTSGLSAVFMLAQYSSPLVVGLLLALARIRARYAVGGGRSLRNMAQGWGNVSAGAAEARVVMRTAGEFLQAACTWSPSSRIGLLPIIQWLLALHPDPVASIRSLFKVRSLSALTSSAKLIPTIQALSLGVYYPAEHVWYLASKGFLGLSPAATSKAATVLIQGWA